MSAADNGLDEAGNGAIAAGMAIIEGTLNDVQTAVFNGEHRVFERLRVHVVSFDGPCPWPSRYTYMACGMPLPDGRACLKSVERRLTCSDGHLWSEHHPYFAFSSDSRMGPCAVDL
ncbi:hypothetical protein R1sor_012917 [Riccia sorocarpa]|uniref:Uncharacterized protein n=1 Tax=Riccia sorocarpa TaxID=122646 RepID=A0ABD3I5R3_9MARC